MPTISTSAREAANAIVQLINSSPRSPRLDEIEAIIAKVAKTPSRAVMVDAWGAEPMARLVALSPEHRKYRELLAEEKIYDAGGGAPEGEEGDAAYAALQERMMAAEKEAWAKPAETLADVLLRGEIALHNENGVMQALDQPDHYLDDRASAELIRAVTDVLGGLHRV